MKKIIAVSLACCITFAFFPSTIAVSQQCMVTPTGDKNAHGSGTVVSSRFGVWRGNHVHAGLDFSTGTGLPLTASTDDTVVLMGFIKGYGNTIIIKRGNGDMVSYHHMRSYGDKFKEGKTKEVKAGDIIGYSGNTGTAGMAAHLHFNYGTPDSVRAAHGLGVKSDGTKVDIKGTRDQPKVFYSGSYPTDPGPYFCDSYPIRDGQTGLVATLGSTTKEQSEKTGSIAVAGATTGSPQQVAAASQQAQAAAAGKPVVEDWLSDTDGSGSLPLPPFGDYASMSPIDMLLTEAQRRFVDANWQSNLSKVSSRALWADYVRMTAVDNYLREARLRKQERIEALWAAYLALKLKPGDAAVKASAQKVLADHARSRIQ